MNDFFGAKGPLQIILEIFPIIFCIFHVNHVETLFLGCEKPNYEDFREESGKSWNDADSSVMEEATENEIQVWIKKFSFVNTFLIEFVI